MMGYNMEQRVEEFVKAYEVISNVTRGNDIMLPMGTDFTYSNAHYWGAAACMPAMMHSGNGAPMHSRPVARAVPLCKCRLMCRGPCIAS